jgi:hypothetical protein
MKLIAENENYVSKDMFDVDRSYNYKLFAVDVKKGKDIRTHKAFVFYTDPNDGHDDSLHFIEDIAEELCGVHTASKETSRWYEVRGDKKWEITLSWDNGRFRNASWVVIESLPE